MAFGLMEKKWGLRSLPLSIKMSRLKHLMVDIAWLHNFCISERLAESNNIKYNLRQKMLLLTRIWLVCCRGGVL